MIRVYFASKLKHAEKWREICAENSHLIAHARWLKHNVLGTPDDQLQAREFWLQDEQDVRDADCVIVYAEPEDHLRGALVEAGIAIATGVPVIVVGDHPDYGTWRHHPGVVGFATLDAAILFMRGLTPSYECMKRTRA